MNREKVCFWIYTFVSAQTTVAVREFEHLMGFPAPTQLVTVSQ